ncbi:MAG: helix-turn-helix transcriptional regulator [Proteobacteria bacterium]|nr:helix-turn-helix transcriptional regulator [Pseudomonadota bacterium]
MKKPPKNIFEEIGFSRSESLSLMRKAELFDEVRSRIDELEMTQAKVAKLLGISQPRISDLKKGKMSVFSIEMLLEFLDKLGGSVNWKFKKAI